MNIPSFIIFLLLFMVGVNRYVLGTFFKKIKRHKKLIEFYPTVTIVTPMYNEGESIINTIKSIIALNYPKDKLNVIIIDDCSNDDSYECAVREAVKHDNIKVIKNEKNVGKRKSINHAVREATSEFIVSVDSDVVLESNSVRELLLNFTSSEIAAVGGRVCVKNRDDNWLSQMQTIKYFYSYEYHKNIENVFSTVMCLSGCLTAYRRHVLLELEPILENRNILGVPIKYGEDRFLTRQIVKAGYKTRLTLDAVCYTKVPINLKGYFSQQLRWRRSNIVDYMFGIFHAWSGHPIVAIHYLCLFAMMVTYPLVIFQSIVDDYFFPLAGIHILFLILLTVWFQIKSYKLPENRKVKNPFSFLAMAIVMPITYLLFTPLAMFTLDSGSWETRNK